MTVETGLIKKEYKEYQKVDPSEIFETAPSKEKFIERYFKEGENTSKVDLELSFKSIEKDENIKWTQKHVIRINLKDSGEIVVTEKNGKESIIFNDEPNSPKQIYDNSINRRHVLESEGNNTYVSKDEFIKTYFSPNTEYSRYLASVNIRFVFITKEGYKEIFEAREISLNENYTVIGKDKHGNLREIYGNEVEPFSVVEINNHHNKKYLKKCLERISHKIRIIRF